MRTRRTFAVAAIALGLTWASIGGCGGSDEQDPVDSASTIGASPDQRAAAPSAPPPPAQQEPAGERDRKSSSGRHQDRKGGSGSREGGGAAHPENPSDGSGGSAQDAQPPPDSDRAKAQKDRGASADAPKNLSDNAKEHAGGPGKPEQELSDSAKDS